MTARPTKYPDWAIAPGDPGDLVEPAAAKVNSGWSPNEKPASQYFNWIGNLLGKWIRYFDETLQASLVGRVLADEWTYPAAKTRTFVVPLELAQPDLTGSWVRKYSGNASLWEKVNAGFNNLIVPLSAVVPSGCVITKYEVLVKPSQARLVNQRMRAIVYDLNLAFPAATAPALGTGYGSADDNGTTNLQVLTVQVGSPGWNAGAVDNANKTRILVIWPGQNGEQGAPADQILGVRVTVTHPGPRNF